MWANNIGGGWECIPGVTYAGNVGKACGGQDKAVSPRGRATTRSPRWAGSNPAAFDFHLTARSPAVDFGRAQYAPAHDRDGNPRSGPPDAGAYEYDSGRPPGGIAAVGGNAPPGGFASA